MSFFQKRLSQITKSDIEALVESSVQEGIDIEFKRALPTRDGSDDRWISKGDGVGDAAKRDIVRELVGFANTHGGTLIIGIEETSDKPSRAQAIRSLPRVGDLADRLKMVCRELIEPAIRNLEVVGIQTDSDGRGVVVLQISEQSPSGPHRHRWDKECYVRRNDETLAMTMEEVRRHSIDLNRLLGTIEEEFRSSRNMLTGRFGAFASSGEPTFLAHLHAVPIGMVTIPNIHRTAAVRPMFTGTPVRRTGGDAPALAKVPRSDDLIWRPKLRGKRARVNWENGGSLSIDLSTDGRLSYELRRSSDKNSPTLYLTWLVGLFANGLLGVERMRRAASAPAAEFVLEFSVLCNPDHKLADYDQRDDFLGTIESRISSNPPLQYSVIDADGFSDLTSAFENDLINLAGADYPGRTATFEFDGGLTRIDDDFK